MLANAMSTPAATRIVNSTMTGADGFDKAMKVLENTYGRPQILFPILIKDIRQQESFPFDYKHVMELWTKYNNSIRDMTRLGGYSATHIMAEMAISEFSPELRDKWNTFNVLNESLPVWEDIDKFLLSHARSLPNKELELVNSKVYTDSTYRSSHSHSESHTSGRSSKYRMSNPTRPRHQTTLRVNSSNSSSNSTSSGCPACSGDMVSPDATHSWAMMLPNVLRLYEIIITTQIVCRLITSAINAHRHTTAANVLAATILYYIVRTNDQRPINWFHNHHHQAQILPWSQATLLWQGHGILTSNRHLNPTPGKAPCTRLS